MIAQMVSTDPAPQAAGGSAGAPGVAAERDLRADIETALKPRARLLRLPPEIEQRYHAVTSRGRNRSLRTWLYLLALIDFLCGVTLRRRRSAAVATPVSKKAVRTAEAEATEPQFVKVSPAPAPAASPSTARLRCSWPIRSGTSGFPAGTCRRS